MKSKEIDFELLEKLGNHLMTGQLLHKVFDFSVFNSDLSYGEYMPNVCGTNGCAIGELPAIDPIRFRFMGNCVFDNTNDDAIEADNNPFNLIYGQFFYLFLPMDYCNNIKQLPHNATRYEVGQRILDFVNAKGNVNIYIR